MARNNIIVINRGDTYEFDITISDIEYTADRYLLKENDVLYFGLMDPGQPFETALIRKRLTVEDTDEAGNITIVIEPEDTLDLLPGTYYYAVKLKLDHHEIDPVTNQPDRYINRVVTVINKTKFIICD